MEAEQYFSALSRMARSTCFVAQVTAADDEVGMDAGEDLGILRRALGLELDHAVGDLLAGLAQDQQHVELGATAHAHEQHLHGAHAEIAPAEIRRPVHDQRVSAAGLGEHRHTLDPLDPRLHDRPLSPTSWAPRDRDQTITDRQAQAACLESGQ